MLAIAAVLAALPIIGQPLAAQHQHGAAPQGRDSTAWRMPPMASMPPIPGLERAVPNVVAFQASAGIADSLVPWARPRELLPVADGDTITLVAGLVRRSIAGRTVMMYGYNGQYPGPIIKTRQSATIYVRLANEIDWPTTVHWHGVRLDSGFDGVPIVGQPAVEPGESFIYRVRLRDAGIYWYHPHVRADVQQDLGLAGSIVVDPGDRGAGSVADREEVLLVDDLLMDDQGLLPYGTEAPTHALMGRFGTVLLANGEPRHQMRARVGEVVRFYFINAASARTFNLSFDSTRVKLIGSDMGRYEHEEWVSSVVIGPAERYTVDVRFDKPGVVSLLNRVQGVDALRGDFVPEQDTVAQIQVAPASGDVSAAYRAYDELRTDSSVVAEMDRYRELLDRAPDRELALDLDMSGLPEILQRSIRADTIYAAPIEWTDPMPMMNWISTGKQVRWILREPSTGRENEAINDWRFKLGELVKIRLVNDSRNVHAMQHPIHLHGQRFLVLERDGLPNDNLVWKDTALIPAGSTVDILLDASNPGQWMLHCHIAEHLEAGMHLTFAVDAGK